MILLVKLAIRTNITGKAIKNKKGEMFLIMDEIIEKLIKDYNLNEYEALIVIGMIGVLSINENTDIKEIYNLIDEKLKPIANQIANN